MLLKLCRFAVTTDAVVWIEIRSRLQFFENGRVTTDAVVLMQWCELKSPLSCYDVATVPVTTDVAEALYMSHQPDTAFYDKGHH